MYLFVVFFDLYVSGRREKANRRGRPSTRKNQVAAGYVLCGSSTIMGNTTGLGVRIFTLDPDIGEFIQSNEDVKIPEYGNICSAEE